MREIDKYVKKDTKELKKMFKELFSMIYETECFSLSDLRRFDLIAFVLQERGVDFEIGHKLKFN